VIGPNSSWTALLPGSLVVCYGTGIVNPALGALALGAASSEDSGMAVGVAGFGALVPAAAALGHGPARAYVAGLHHALFVGAALAAAGALGTAVLAGSRRSRHLNTSTLAAAEPTPEIT
jgi:hypothetical protein